MNRIEEHGIALQSFYTWRQRLRREKPVTFALVEKGGDSAGPGMLELLLSGGHRLRVPTEASSLRMVFEALRDSA